MIRRHIFIKGNVQGVNFRYNTEKRANKLGLTGWGKNLPNGNVEIVVEGEEDKVNELIEFCKHGPTYARVYDIEIIEEKYKGEFGGFEIKY
tara:strand:- start:241 stop:513 length:273 start_codon:yes stop_codon:yes gene_type:complete